MGGNDADQASSLVVDNGKVIVLGFCTGNTTNKFGDGVHDTVVNATAGLQFIARFDTSGNFIDVKNYPWDYSKLFLNSQGNYLITNGLSAAKINPSGTVISTYTFVTLTPFYPSVTGISMDKNDNIYICSLFNNTINIGPGTVLSPTTSTLIANTYAANSLIMKFSSTGIMSWYKRGNTSVADNLQGCTVDTSGTKLATGGAAWNGSTVFSYYVTSGVGTNGATFYLLDAGTGNFISAKTGTANGQPQLAPYYTDRDNNFICKGHTNGFLAFNSTTNTVAGAAGNHQNLIGKFDANGNFVSLNLLPQMGSSNGRNKVNGLDVSEQGNIYVGGMFGGTLDSAGVAVSLSGGLEDGFVAKYGFACNSTSTSLSPLPPTSLTAVYQASLTNKVTWIDYAQFETGYELWAIGGSITAYSLIASLAANTTTYTHINLQAGKTYCYKARAINSTGSSFFTNIGCAATPSTGGTIGIAEINIVADVNVYPNPTTGPVNLQFVSTGKMADIEVMNVLGAVVEKQELQTIAGENNFILNMPKTKGIYMVRIVTENSRMVKKVVVE